MGEAYLNDLFFPHVEEEATEVDRYQRATRYARIHSATLTSISFKSSPT